ncbi:hypothetical protein F511_16135 [Dorcoceras hygrometricum]|uniref:HNH nuclease domain-containing protein n=1 Tax=Dorcoceras hygrometricum TaxID=472368 RepID=A0A2Z7DCI9_9LAMI|nr:hypothetical protein F511_16135 [Dorcoceras hygrometricum]
MSSRSGSASPRKDEERPRFFDSIAKNRCWAKAETVPGRHPDRWRKDAAGNIVLCVHSIPKNRCWAKAETVPGRHPDRWRKDAAGNIVCKRFCNCQGCLCFEYDHIIPYSKDKELDIIEMAVYGEVIRPGNQCRCRTVAEVLGTYKSKDRMDACKLPYREDSLHQ